MIDERDLRARLAHDLTYYAERCLHVLPKDAGTTVPFRFNRIQVELHRRLEEQKERTGKVRALVLKGRQVGISTYIGARFYHRVTHAFGTRVFILTHEQDATDTLFDMVVRFHEHVPAIVKPSTGNASAKELFFDKLDSGYVVGTAGTKAVGRSKTVQLFHGSEVAFWPHAPTHFAGAVQAVPDLAGTEIILESTANGIGGEFHERWQKAEIGEGDYIPIFLPWFWHEGYRRPVPKGFVLDDDEDEYGRLYGLDTEQLVWRRAKIAELKDPLLFKQEYPATAAEAFQLTGHDSYIKPELVVAARKAKHNGVGPLVLGVDPARFGDDRFSIAWRKGRKVLKVESRNKLDTVEGANWIKTVIDAEKPACVFVDVGGHGAGVVDVLRNWGDKYGDVVKPINFGGSPQEVFEVLEGGEQRPGPRNRRAEMWKRSREWLMEPGGADIPDIDSLHADAVGPGYKYDSNQRLVLESKEHMRERGVRSPDEWDAVALTFAEPVSDGASDFHRKINYGKTGVI